MSESTLKVLSKIVSVILMFLGGIYAFTGIAVLFGLSVAGVGENLATGIGKSIDGFPYAYAIIGGGIVLLFGIAHIIIGNGVWRLQKWAPTGLYIFAAYNFLSSMGFGAQNITSMLFSIFVAWVGYSLSTQGKKLLK